MEHPKKKSKSNNVDPHPIITGKSIMDRQEYVPMFDPPDPREGWVSYHPRAPLKKSTSEAVFGPKRGVKAVPTPSQQELEDEIQQEMDIQADIQPTHDAHTMNNDNEPLAGPSAPSAPRRQYNRRNKKTEGITAYTKAFVPGLYNVKNPAGDFMQRDTNVEVIRQISQQKKDETPTPLTNILIIHPGSRNLRVGRASDFYPHEVPNCIARPANAAHRGTDPPVPNISGDADAKIGFLREYLRNRLRQNKLTTDWKEGARVTAANQKARPEAIPEHNDVYRLDWTELEGRPYIIGSEALRLPASSPYRVRYPILGRHFNTRDWKSTQLLLDDITTILQETLRTELGISPTEYSDYAVFFIVPDHGERLYVQEMTNIILNVMGFKEIAVHQESYCAIFSAGMSSACVVDIGAQQTSVTCVDEGIVNADTRITLSYGGDDVTAALTSMLERSAFPYRELDLGRAQDWIMMDNLKIRVCTLEEHLVANTSWEFYVLTEGLTQKYILRTYDENILAPLCFFDTRMIAFEGKKGDKLWNPSGDVSDLIRSTYDETTGAMKSCTTHLFPQVEQPVVAGDGAEAGETPVVDSGTPIPVLEIIAPSKAATPIPDGDAIEDQQPKYDIVYEASKTPLDGAIAASISMCGTENKVKAAASSVLLIGGGSALKGLGPFIAERLAPLIRAKGFPIAEVQIVPPPRNLNPKFVCWKGASVMCNLDSLSDMWIRRDEFEAIGARALKERCLFV